MTPFHDEEAVSRVAARMQLHWRRRRWLMPLRNPPDIFREFASLALTEYEALLMERMNVLIGDFGLLMQGIAEAMDRIDSQKPETRLCADSAGDHSHAGAEAKDRAEHSMSAGKGPSETTG